MLFIQRALAVSVFTPHIQRSVSAEGCTVSSWLGLTMFALVWSGKRGEEVPNIPWLGNCWKIGWKPKKIKKAPAPRAWFIFKACCLLSYEREAGKWCFKKISANFQLPCCRGFGFNPQLCSKSSSQCLPLNSISQLSSAFHPSETLGTPFSAVSLPSCHYSGRCAQVF